MCGIAGMIGPGVAEKAAVTAAPLMSAIRYRGRDDEGQWSDRANALMLHSRLVIIDPNTGGQPMWDHTGRYVIVHNGEVYNYIELRAAYAAKGGQFRTQSDTETILEGYKQKGPAVCGDLNGMYAFAIWDTQEQTLFLARDRLGKKPLFWCRIGADFYFSSSLDGFLALPKFDAGLCPIAVEQFTTLGGILGDRTIYRSARALPPAHWMILSPGRAPSPPRRYWSLDFRNKSKASLETAIGDYERLLVDAVRIRLRADVPLALTFSGGVDSGSIAAICRRHLDHAPACYTIDYHTDDDQSSETVMAERVARHLDLPWQHIQFEYQSRLLDELRQTYVSFDQPSMQLPLVYSQRLYEAIKPYATVVVSGNGADELFTGYDGDERLRLQDAAIGLSRPLRPLLRAIGGPAYLRKPLIDAFIETLQSRIHDQTARTATATWLDDDMRRCGVASRLDLTMYLALVAGAADANYRLPDISGLAAQVEVRSPYLDYRLVDFAARLPARHKIGNPFKVGSAKYLPKQYYQRMVPRDVAWAPKKGMGWNLRWQYSIAEDQSFREAFATAYDRMETAGFDAAPHRAAWRGYMKDITSGRSSSRDSTLMMGGFMLGTWLDVKGIA